MRLLIVTPGAVVVDIDDVAGVRAEDDSGEFGILPHHADFVTALSISVVGWRRSGGGQGNCAVGGGLLTVSGGQEVAIATRAAVPGDDLGALEAVVRERLTDEMEQERRARMKAERLRAEAIRQVVGYLRRAPAQGEGAAT